MPWVCRAPAIAEKRVEEEPMEVDELAGEQGEKEEPITKSLIDYQFLCDEMASFWYKIVDIRPKDWEEHYLGNQRLNKLEQIMDKQEEMLRAIIERLPSTLGALSSTP